MKPDPQKKSKFAKFSRIASYIFFAVYIITALMVCGILLYLSVLPLRYLSVIIITAIIFGGVFGFFVFRKKTRLTTRNTITALEIVFATVFIICFVVLNISLNLLSALQAGGYQTEEYSVVTLSSYPYTTLDELSGQSVAIYSDPSDSYQSALSDLKKSVSFVPTEYSDVVDATSALLDGRVDALFMKTAMMSLVGEILPSFKSDNIRIIHTFTIRTVIESDSSSNIDVTKDSFNIYISGIDTAGDISTVSRSDVNMIVTVNPRTYQILMVSIPRDYYVQLHGTTGPKDKLTHSGLYGINTTVATAEDLFNTKINYYIRVNFDSTEKIIDTIGGINLTPDTTFSAHTDHGNICYFYANETIHVDGECGLIYARTRKAYTDGDFHRIQNQQEVLTAILDRISEIKSLSAYTDLLSSVEGTIETNIPTGQIYKLINLQLDRFPHWQIERIRVNGTDSEEYTYSVYTEPLYVMLPDMDTVSAASSRINAVLAE